MKVIDECEIEWKLLSDICYVLRKNDMIKPLESREDVILWLEKFRDIKNNLFTKLVLLDSGAVD